MDIKDKKAGVINSNKLCRIKTYAELKGTHKENVRYWIKKKKVNTLVIDGTIFIINK